MLIALGVTGGIVGVAAGCARGEGRTPVVLYSPHGPDQLGILERAFEATGFHSSSGLVRCSAITRFVLTETTLVRR